MWPYGVTLGRDGTLFGTTIASRVWSGSGLVYHLKPGAGGKGAWTFSTIFDDGKPDDSAPYSALTADERGNLYGVDKGGAVYRLVRPAHKNGRWQRESLHAFTDPKFGRAAGELSINKQGAV